MSIVRLDTGPKRSIGRLLGGEKGNFFVRCAEVVSRAGGMLSIRGPQVSLGSPRVGTRRVQSPIPHAPALGSYLPILLAVQTAEARFASVWRSRALRAIGCPKLLRMRCRLLTNNVYNPWGVREPISTPKKCFIWARCHPRTSNTLIIQGPPRIILAVSLGPILPHL